MFTGKDRQNSRKGAEQVEVSPRFRITAAVQSDAGCVRELNEDAGQFLQPADSVLLPGQGSLAIVADGMGGHSAGEVASRMAVEIITKTYYETDKAPGEALKSAFEEANLKIYESSIADEKLKGMGTTCTALLLRDDLAFAAHVGDSRLYMLRETEIYLLTEDHSAVMELVKQGIISPEEARHHEDKNVILRALGTAPTVEVSLWHDPLSLRIHDRFILCSDGLYDLVEDQEIKDLLLSSSDAHIACAKLIALAKQRGGYDNITVAIISIESPSNVAPGKPRETREAEVFV